ncbi:subtilisin-like protease [Curcuma longa]|uniref:subtilisin-like protease n=1 Tax=Curcuma longa TaxID=136217 RepID=UPI003D9F4916
MASPNSPFIRFLFVSFLLSSNLNSIHANVFGRRIFPHFDIADVKESHDHKLQLFIIHVRRPKGLVFSLAEEWKGWYESLLKRAIAHLSLEVDHDSPVSRLVHAYRNVMVGFAARFTAREIEQLSRLAWFVHAYPDPNYDLLTTHSPEFLGLRLPSGKSSPIWDQSNMGEGIIIGVLDSGVTPGHPSFADHGMPPPPAKWKGRCDFNGSVCNNKLIGARSFVGSLDNFAGLSGPPIDQGGHGTHTASTAAGAAVDHAEAFGVGAGVASGMAPRAHLAVYQVCDKQRCAGSDILAALDAAIDDGVDVLSLSVGGRSMPFHSDPVSIGGYAAIKKGIFVSCSAGNSGPTPETLSNDAPWLLTVAASTTDRTLKATVKLGDGQEFDGETLSQKPLDFGSTMLPLVWAGDGRTPNAAMCTNGSLDVMDVKGKVVVCERGENGRTEKGNIVKSAGGAGMVLMNQQLDGYSTLADQHVLPTSHVAYDYGSKIKTYIKSTKNPTAAIVFKGTVMGAPHSPAVASFSSRGPSKVSPGILKPDITGPGVSILAAWPSPASSASFNIQSGTSMSCPHLSGVAALVKKAHPDWSAAAVKSALMTTAYATDSAGQPLVDETMLPAGFYAIGSGHVDPSKAMDPGLIYETEFDDYIPYLCGLGYTDAQMQALVHDRVSCLETKSIAESELNYPSIAVLLGGSDSGGVILTRTVTNVGDAKEEYSSEIDAPKGFEVSVEPKKLLFTELNQKQTFKITIQNKGGGSGTAEGQLRWASRKHIVRSPISIKLNE